MDRLRGKQSAEVAAQTRLKILEAAGQQFAAHGFLAASLRDIAKAAGTTHGLIRHHFGTKVDLWKSVVDDFIDRVETKHLPLLQGADDKEPVALLKALATNYMRQSAEMPEVSKLMLKDCSEDGPRLDYLVERIRPAHQAITPVFERVHAAGYLKQHDPDSFFLFLVMLGSMPSAIANFTNKFYREDIRTDQGIDAHIKRVLITLFGEEW